MRQTGCDEFRSKTTSKKLTFYEITSKYSKKGSMSKVGIELFIAYAKFVVKGNDIIFDKGRKKSTEKIREPQKKIMVLFKIIFLK